MIDYAAFAGRRDHLALTPSADAIAAFAAAALDGHAAHRAGPDCLAPPTYAFVLAMTGDAFPFPTRGLIHAEQTFAFAGPVRAGEPLRIERGLARARRRGEGEAATWVLTWEAEGIAPDGRRPFAFTSRLLARPEAPSPAGEGPPPEGAPAGGDPPPASADLRGAVHLLDRETIRAYARASGDTNPIHLDDDAARAYGLGGVVAHGMLSLALVAALAEEWAAADGRDLTALSGRFVAPVAAGERVQAVGRSLDDAQAEFWLLGEDGRVRVRGRAHRTAAGV
jgi:acyl dehydratase